MICHCWPGSKDTLPSDSLDSECCDHQEKSGIGGVKESLHSSPSHSSVSNHLVQTVNQTNVLQKKGAGFKYKVAKKPNIDCIMISAQAFSHFTQCANRIAGDF